MSVNSQLYGGNGGGAFDDTMLWTSSGPPRINRIVVRSGDRIDKISIWYGLPGGREEMRAHGGEGGNDHPDIVLQPDEKICGVLRSGGAVDSLMFVTYRGGNMANLHRYGPYGGGGGQEHAIFCDNLVAFNGRSGAALDAIGFLSVNSMISTYKMLAHGLSRASTSSLFRRVRRSQPSRSSS